MRLLGFTGTRQGCTDAQLHALARAIGHHSQPNHALSPGQFHHGRAVGADAQAHGLAQYMRWEVHVWPSHGTDGATVPLPYVEHPKGDPLERNRQIIEATDHLIACPAGMAEELRSGTWAAVRYARRLRRPITLCWPDGTTTRERGYRPDRQEPLPLEPQP
jgi:hypothetical protein